MATKPTLPPSVWAENRSTLPATTDSQWGRGFEYTSTTSGGKALTETFDYPLFKIDESLRWLRDLFDDNGVISSLPDATATQKGVVEKATIDEAESGASDKFPDAAGVIAAFNQYGLGAEATYASDLSSDLMTGFYGVDAETVGTPDGRGGYLVRNRRGSENRTFDIFANSTEDQNLYYRVKFDEQDSGYRKVLSSADKATTSEAESGASDKFPDAAGVVAAISAKSLGTASQDYTDVSSIRQAGVVYTNTDTAPRFVTISDVSSGLRDDNYQVRKNSSSAWVTVGRNSSEAGLNVGFIVPPGFQYRANNFSNFNHWSELSL